MASTGKRKLQSKVERLRQFICESLVGLAIWACGKNVGLETLQAKAEELQPAKRRRLPMQGDVFETDVLVKRVMEFVGPNEYLFAANISRKSRQMQFVLSYKDAAENNCTTDKLRTSFTAALASPARLQWAFNSGLKQKDAYDTPLQLVQSAMKASADPLSVLNLLNVQSMKEVDPKAGSALCATAAERSDLELLKWLHAHDCPWGAKCCIWAAYNNRLDILQWAREHGCPWDAGTCWGATEGGNLCILQWAREQGCPWDEFACLNAAWKGRSDILQWARANGCAWNRENVLRIAAKWGGVNMLEWLQHNSGEPWSEADKAAMLVEAGRCYQPAAELQWLRDRGASWPTSFIGSTMFHRVLPVKICWTVPAIRWALARGCAWGEWQCQQLAPDLYAAPINKKNAIEVFAWAHKNGCPCTCTSSSSSSGSSQES
jgi:hypothetical protein